MRLLLRFAAACLSLQAAEPVSIQLQQGSISVRGWSAPARAPSAGWSSILSVYAGSGDVPPLLGSYSVQAGTLTFRPKYPLSPGLKVRVAFKGKDTFFEIPRAIVTPSARVQQVFPTSSVLPENQLKFYIEFSRPMSQGEAWKHIQLLTSDGHPVELPFLEIDQEMWDADSKRLTILFDPGRIKRGVKPLEDIGAAIEAGRSYALVIDSAWHDASGAPLVASHRKEFRVGHADRTPVDPAAWRIQSPPRGTKTPLVITFPEPLDAALALRLIWVEGVRGTATLGPEEREWRFTPEREWTAEPHLLKVDTALEDLAGNKVGRPFDVDVFDRVTRQVDREVISIPLP